MRGIRRWAALVAPAFVLCGCANLNTVERRTVLPNGGKAVHLDAVQRVAVANNKGWVCAEPSPDAIQAYAASLGAGIGTLSKDAASVAQALSTSSGSIGLRTQSITLMRDALYRICELYFNGALPEEDVIQLLKRSQDLSLGVMAIEQLTGAVVAQQVVLNTSSSATAAAAINDTQKELDKAKANEDAKKKAADTAQSDLETQKKLVDTKTSEAADSRKKARPTQALIDALAPQLKKAEGDLEAAIDSRLALRNAVVGHEANVRGLTIRREATAKQLAALHDVTVKTQAKLDAAKVAVPVDQVAIDNLTKDLKTASDAESAATIRIGKQDAELATAKGELQKAQDAAATADDPVNAAQGHVDQLNAQLKALREDENQVTADKAASELKTAADDLKKQEAAASDAKAQLEKAQANTKEIERLGNAAIASASASGGGASQFSRSTGNFGVSKDTAEILARATTDIVQAVVNKGHLTDSCSALLVSYVSRSEHSDGVNAAFAKVLPLCQEVISATLSVYRARGGQAPAGAQFPAAPLAFPSSTLRQPDASQ